MRNKIRKWIANKLARLARRIYPESEEVMSFWTDRMTEMVIMGQSNIKVFVDPAMPDDEMVMRSGRSSVRVPNLLKP